MRKPTPRPASAFSGDVKSSLNEELMMNVFRAALAVGLASTMVVSSVGMVFASSHGAHRRTAHGLGRHDAHRGHVRDYADFGAPARAYYSDGYYGGVAYGFFGAPTYGLYRDGY
jgi:hypothetical protein